MYTQSLAQNLELEFEGLTQILEVLRMKAWRLEDLKTWRLLKIQECCGLWFVVFHVIPSRIWRLVAFEFCIVNLLRVLWESIKTPFLVCDNEVGVMTHKVVFCRSHWWGAIAGHRGFESLGANLSDGSSCLLSRFTRPRPVVSYHPTLTLNPYRAATW